MEADVVSLFLLQETNQKLITKFKKELKPGTKIISHCFTFENWKPVRVLNTKGTYGPVFLYKL